MFILRLTWEYLCSHFHDVMNTSSPKTMWVRLLFCLLLNFPSTRGAYTRFGDKKYAIQSWFKILHKFIWRVYMRDKHSEWEIRKERSFIKHLYIYQFISFSHVRLFATSWTAARQASLSITNSWSLPKLMSTESVMPSKHLILCYPLLLWPSIFPSIRVFSNESILHIRWPKYQSFSFSPSNEHSELISFRMDWLDLLAVQGTLKSLLQQKKSSTGFWQILITILVHWNYFWPIKYCIISLNICPEVQD